MRRPRESSPAVPAGTEALRAKYLELCRKYAALVGRLEQRAGRQEPELLRVREPLLQRVPGYEIDVRTLAGPCDLAQDRPGVVRAVSDRDRQQPCLVLGVKA